MRSTIPSPARSAEVRNRAPISEPATTPAPCRETDDRDGRQRELETGAGSDRSGERRRDPRPEKQPDDQPGQ